MKKSHIAIIVIIAVSIAGLISKIGGDDFSSYKNFASAKNNLGQEITVIGYLDKDKPVNFNAKNIMLSFEAIDKEGNSSKVYINKPKPQDFEKSEEITMKGYATDTAFIAKEILMKCPSKYNDKNQMLGNEDSYSTAE